MQDSRKPSSTGTPGTGGRRQGVTRRRTLTGIGIGCLIICVGSCILFCRLRPATAFRVTWYEDGQRRTRTVRGSEADALRGDLSRLFEGTCRYDDGAGDVRRSLVSMEGTRRLMTLATMGVSLGLLLGPVFLLFALPDRKESAR
jgi:hypothetical protein